MADVVGRLAWPVIAGGAFVALAVSPTWITASVVVGGAGLAILLLERARPFRRAWMPDRRAWRHDLAYVALSSAIAGGLQAVLAGEARPLSFGDRLAWIAGGLAVMDLVAYGVHRLLHRVRVLWPIHEVHHAVDRVYFLNALHNHALDIALSTALSLVPLWLLGVPGDVVAAIGALATVCFWLQHANARIELGALNLVVSGPELHRWHHSRVRGEADANYGMVFAIWDLLFGTWRAPGAPDAIGVAGAPPMTTLAEQLRAPFRRR